MAGVKRACNEDRERSLARRSKSRHWVSPSWRAVKGIELAEKIGEKADQATKGADVGSLSRGLGILSLFDVGKPAMTFAEIQQGISLPKASVHRLLKSLLQLGFLTFDSVTKRYHPGPKVMNLGFTALHALSFADKSGPIMTAVSQEINQTIGLSLRDGDEIVIGHRVSPSNNIVNVNLNVGSRVMLHRTGAGRLFLALDRSPEFQESYASKFIALMSNQERRHLQQHVEFARRHFYSFNDEELSAGFRVVAVPVWSFEEKMTAALYAACASYQLSMDELVRLSIPSLAKASADLSSLLGASRRIVSEHYPVIPSDERHEFPQRSHG